METWEIEKIGLGRGGLHPGQISFVGEWASLDLIKVEGGANLSWIRKRERELHQIQALVLKQQKMYLSFTNGVERTSPHQSARGEFDETNSALWEQETEAFQIELEERVSDPLKENNDMTTVGKVADVASSLCKCQNNNDVWDWIKFMVVPLAGNLGWSSQMGRIGLEKLFGELHSKNNAFKEQGVTENCSHGGDGNSYVGRVITVKWEDFTRKIGIDGTADAIKEAIKSAFRLRTRRAFWLEDEVGIVRCLDRDMPLGAYTLHLDEGNCNLILSMSISFTTLHRALIVNPQPSGITIKICLYDDADRIVVRTEENTLYTEDDFRDFLTRRGWTGLRELSGFRSVDTLDELRSGAMYQCVRMLGD
ncbi:hypothetical protein IFM89_018985 [Coptis chinensis]|uniref:GT-1/4-like C-terminal domain-containing protein n=1 Tax=Coptis chinensis TaxID=261450 RepID=A0A835I1E5_9MAGN|nr:hypothetical protein IFM89_018985 [Coptis chinensis]